MIDGNTVDDESDVTVRKRKTADAEFQTLSLFFPMKPIHLIVKQK